MSLPSAKSLAFTFAACLHATAAHADGAFGFPFTDRLMPDQKSSYFEATFDWTKGLADAWSLDPARLHGALTQKTAPQPVLQNGMFQGLLDFAQGMGSNNTAPAEPYAMDDTPALGFGFRLGLDF